MYLEFKLRNMSNSEQLSLFFYIFKTASLYV